MNSRTLKVALAIAASGLAGVVFYWFLARPKPLEEARLPKPEAAGTAFSSFGPTNSYIDVSGWSAGTNAHAEWFVAGVSGSLAAIEIALEPNYVRKGREGTAGNATVRIALDTNGFPGAVLEQFSIVADTPSSPPPLLPLVLRSGVRPRLEAGAKYWLCAGCAGPRGWIWRDNNQRLMRVSAREREPGNWASAGNGRNGAFRITVAEELEDTPHR
jgi:hypothetical protein